MTKKMSKQNFEAVNFDPFQQVQIEIEKGPLEGNYTTYVNDLDRTQMDIRVPVENNLFLPLAEGTMVTFRCNKLSGSYECRIKIRDRKDEGTYPTLTIPKPARMKRIQQRKDVRVPTDFSADLWVLEEDTEKIKEGPFTVTVVDISAGGMKIHSPERPGDNAEVVLDFELPIINQKFETVFARVVRVFEETVGDQYVSALKFSGLTSTQRDHIIKYAYRRQIQLKRQGRWVNE